MNMAHHAGAETTETGIDNTNSGLLPTLPDGSTLPAETWERRHKWFIIAVLSHIPFLLALGLYETAQSPLAGASIPAIPPGRVLLQIGIIAGLAFAAALPQLSRRVRTTLAVTGLAFCTGALVHFSGGYIEAHFHFFVAVGIAAVYEDWIPFGVGLGYVLISHVVFGLVEPSMVYNHTAAQLNPIVWGGIHGGFVLILAGALTIHLSSIEQSRREAQTELERARQRATQIENLEAEREEIEQQRAEAQQLKQEAQQEREEVEALNSHIELKATKYRDAMDHLANGDLTARVETDSQNEAMSEIGRAFNQMADELAETVGEIQSVTEDVDRKVTESESAVGEIAQASDGVSDSVQQIATGAEDQRKMIEDASDEVSNFSAAVEEIAASASEVAQLSGDTAAVADEGQEIADDTLSDAKEVKTSIEETVDTVAELDAQMDEIAEIVDLITDIAEQTNMLALNANIEAARAGGGETGADGGGFAVVADEVKQLAAETQNSAEEIKSRIEGVQTQTGTVVAQVEQASELVTKEIRAVEDVVEAFEQVAENTEETDIGVKEINQTTESQASTSENVVSMIDEVAEISAASADETESVSATVQEQTAALGEVSSNMQTLSDSARDLEQVVNQFTLERTATHAD